MALRFANVIFEALEQPLYRQYPDYRGGNLGGRDRANYYDNYGAIRDMLQNHLYNCFV